MDLWHGWVVAGVVLIIAEIFTPGFVVACFGIACFPAALLAALGASLTWQLAVFAASTLAVVLGIRPFFSRHLSSAQGNAKTNVDALPGQTAFVTQTIDSSQDTGRAKIAGDDWRAIAADETVIEAGQRVTVLKVDGTKLLVERIAPAKEK